MTVVQWIDSRIPGGRSSRQGAVDLLCLLGFSNGTGAGG